MNWSQSQRNLLGLLVLVHTDVLRQIHSVCQEQMKLLNSIWFIHELISLRVDVFYVSNKEICWADFLFVSLAGSLSSEDALVVLENKLQPYLFN